MGVYIKGMEMPKRTYAYCMLIKDIDGSVKLHVCTEHSEYSSEWEQYDIVPVPPHGRLIDADALINAKSVNNIGIIMDIADAPTIIPASEEGEI